jgi:hypothetical protein
VCDSGFELSGERKKKLLKKRRGKKKPGRDCNEAASTRST